MQEQVNFTIAHSAKELMTEVMCDSFNTSKYHKGMAIWMDENLETLMKLSMDLMDQVMKMRSENTRILTRSARKRTPPALLDGLTDHHWEPSKETDGEHDFMSTLQFKNDEGEDILASLKDEPSDSNDENK